MQEEIKQNIDHAASALRTAKERLKEAAHAVAQKNERLAALKREFESEIESLRALDETAKECLYKVEQAEERYGFYTRELVDHPYGY